MKSTILASGSLLLLVFVEREVVLAAFSSRGIVPILGRVGRSSFGLMLSVSLKPVSLAIDISCEGRRALTRSLS